MWCSRLRAAQFFSVLGDVIAVRWLHAGYSVGDLVIAVALIVRAAMTQRPEPQRGEVSRA
jgi:hypothetical protein